MQEIWENIKGYEGIYQVSNQGNVRSLPRTIVDGANHKKHYKGKILTPRIDKGGYKIIDLRNGYDKKTYKVHRLVALAFIPNPNNKPEINHKKENEKWNNSIDNLEWVTSKENMNYGTMNQRKAERFSKTVYQYTLDNKLIKVWKSTKECGRNGFNQSHVGECCRGIVHTHNHFKWSYKLY